MERSLMNAKNSFKSFLILTLFTLCATTYCAERSSTPIFPDWLQELSQEMGTVCNPEKLSDAQKLEKTNKAFQETFLHFILTDSTKAALYNKKAFESFNLIEGLPEMSSSEVEILVNAYQKKCPLFLLAECDGTSCPLSRCCDHSCSREEFERQAAQELCAKMETSSKKTIQYCSFGSGGMLLDCFIIAKALHAQKLQSKIASKITIHLIDDSYDVYITMRDRSTGHRKINSSYTLKDIFAASSFSLEEKESGLRHMSTHHEFLYQQFIVFLQTHFKEAELSLFVHESTQSYLTYCTVNKIDFPDIIVGADIADKKDREKKPVEHFNTLCNASLEKNPQCSVLLLSGKQTETTFTPRIHTNLKNHCS